MSHADHVGTLQNRSCSKFGRAYLSAACLTACRPSCQPGTTASGCQHERSCSGRGVSDAEVVCQTHETVQRLTTRSASLAPQLEAGSMGDGAADAMCQTHETLQRLTTHVTSLAGSTAGAAPAIVELWCQTASDTCDFLMPGNTSCQPGTAARGCQLGSWCSSSVLSDAEVLHQTHVTVRSDNTSCQPGRRYS